MKWTNKVLAYSKWLCYDAAMTRTGETSTERTLIRTIAGAARPLNEDLDLTALQAIDRLQKLHAKFSEHWIRPPWLVLEDGYVLPVNLSVADMLEEMGKHGKHIAIVGPVLLPTTRSVNAFRMMFRKDAKSRKTAEVSARAAINDVMERIRQMQERTQEKSQVKTKAPKGDDLRGREPKFRTC